MEPSKILTGLLLLAAVNTASAFRDTDDLPYLPAYGPLTTGTLTCENSRYEKIALTVRQHPTKANKAILNWDGTDHIVHIVPTKTAAVRYEGAVSNLVYVQVPQRSILLDNNSHHPVLTDCVKQRK